MIFNNKKFILNNCYQKILNYSAQILKNVRFEIIESAKERSTSESGGKSKPLLLEAFVCIFEWSRCCRGKKLGHNQSNYDAIRRWAKNR